jgi:dihydroorotase-like cyclic amidohydrolase
LIAREARGALVMVHCEGYDAIRFMTDRLERAGKTAPYYHAISRPESVEREATHRAISHTELTDVPIMIVHVSGREPIKQIRWAQRKGLKIYGETYPQYVALTADDLKGFEHGRNWWQVCLFAAPTGPGELGREIWEGIRTGVFQTFSSDHCPFTYGGVMGKLNPKARTSFRWVPNGIPGVETRLQILFSKGVVEGRITLNEFVALTSTNHAKMYGLYPKKGSIALGFDADIVIWDPNRKETIRQELMHHGADYTPYEGRAVTGWPDNDHPAWQGRHGGRQDFGNSRGREFPEAWTLTVCCAAAGRCLRRTGPASKVLRSSARPGAKVLPDSGRLIWRPIFFGLARLYRSGDGILSSTFSSSPRSGVTSTPSIHCALNIV